MITPVTILAAFSLSLVSALFTQRKLEFLVCCVSAFGAAYLVLPTTFSSPPIWVRGYDLHDFLQFDLPLLVGMLFGLTAAIYSLNRWKFFYWTWAASVSFVLCGVVTILFEVFRELYWRLFQ